MSDRNNWVFPKHSMNEWWKHRVFPKHSMNECFQNTQWMSVSKTLSQHFHFLLTAKMLRKWFQNLLLHLLYTLLKFTSTALQTTIPKKIIFTCRETMDCEEGHDRRIEGPFRGLPVLRIRRTTSLHVLSIRRTVVVHVMCIRRFKSLLCMCWVFGEQLFCSLCRAFGE